MVSSWEEDTCNPSLWKDEEASTECRGDSTGSASAVSQYSGGTGALALNSEEVSYGGGAVRLVSALNKEGSYAALLLIFDDSIFARISAHES